MYETLNSKEYEWFNEFKKIITENTNIKINYLILSILEAHLSNLYCYPYTIKTLEKNTKYEYQVPNNFTNKNDMDLIENECIKIASNVLENITSKQPVTPVKIMSPEYLYPNSLTPQTPIFEIPLKKRKLYGDFYEENNSPLETKYKKGGLIQPTKTRKKNESKKLNKNKHMVRKSRRQ